MNSNIEVIARSFIIKDGEVLICKVKTKDHWFFPGGHVEFGETASAALAREIKEETGTEISDINFIGICENKFSDSEGVHQELNIVFEAKIREYNITADEDHMQFSWLKIKDFTILNIMPIKLKNAFKEWLKNRKNFYIE